MPGKGRYQNDFDAPPLPAPAPATIGPREIRSEHHGRTKYTRIDPSDYRCSRLVAELAGALSDRHVAKNLAWGTSQHGVAAIRNFASWIDKKPAPDAFYAATITVDDLEEWQTHLISKHGSNAGQPWLHATNLFVLLRWLDAQTETIVNAEIRTRIRATPTGQKRNDATIDELAPAARKAIEAAARRGVGQLKLMLSLSRRQDGPMADALAALRTGALTQNWLTERYGPTASDLPPDLLAALEFSGAVKKEDPEVEVRNLARRLRDEGNTSTQIAARLNDSEFRPPKAAHWTPRLLERFLREDFREWRADSLVGAIEGVLWPTEHALMPIVILLGLRTGLPPECIRDLTTDCVTSSDSRFATIEYVKRRGKGRDSRRVSNKGEFAPARLIDLAIAVTEQLRPLLADDLQGRLFVCRTRRAAGVTLRAADFSGEFPRWLSREGISLPGRADLRVLRKTHKAARAMALQGSLEDIADDQTTQVAAKHYVTTSTIHVINGGVIRSIQGRIHSQITGPTVLLPDAVEALFDDDAQPDQALLDAASGRLDVGLASCSDVRASPFAAPGELCPAAFGGGCFSCPNAVITERQLPAILLFVDHIESQRRELPPSVWEKRWLSSLTRINEEILPAFPPTVVSAAREQALGDPAELYLPATMLATSSR